MNGDWRDTSRLGEIVLASSLSLVGLATAVLRLLANPNSRLSRFVDRNCLPDGVSFR